MAVRIRINTQLKLAFLLVQIQTLLLSYIDEQMFISRVKFFLVLFSYFESSHAFYSSIIFSNVHFRVADPGPQVSALFSEAAFE
jgi:hypothetical protein